MGQETRSSLKVGIETDSLLACSLGRRLLLGSQQQQNSANGESIRANVRNGRSPLPGACCCSSACVRSCKLQGTHSGYTAIDSQPIEPRAKIEDLGRRNESRWPHGPPAHIRSRTAESAWIDHSQSSHRPSYTKPNERPITQSIIRSTDTGALLLQIDRAGQRRTGVDWVGAAQPAGTWGRQAGRRGRKAGRQAR